MKKQIISVLILISLSFQSTYPVFEGIKKRFGGSIEQAKNLLNARENIRCLRRGDNCSKERRVLLGVISALVAALVAAGVIIAGQAMLGKKGVQVSVAEKGQSSENQLNIDLMFNYAINHLSDMTAWNVLKNMEREKGISFKDVRNKNRTLIGAFLNRLKRVNSYTEDQIAVIAVLLQEIKPTQEDLVEANDLELVLKFPDKRNTDIVKRILRIVRGEEQIF